MLAMMVLKFKNKTDSLEVNGGTILQYQVICINSIL